MIGNDSNTCGAQLFPCKTLRHTLDLVEDGSSIYLDGRATKSHPYGCEEPTASPARTSEFLHKNLSITGIYERAYLSCDHGLRFKNPSDIEILNVSLKNLSFLGTGIRFLGNCAVNILNSTFTNCTPAMTMTGRIVKLSLRTSVFTNNTDCLHIKTRNLSEGVDGAVMVDISHVVFKRNRAHFYESMTAVIFVENYSGMTSVDVRNSFFEENGSAKSLSYFSNLLAVYTDKRNMGVLRLINSSFIANSCGIVVLGCLNMYFHNITFSSNDKGFLLQPKMNNNAAEIIFSDSTFSNNSANLQLSLGGVQNETNITVQIRNTVFSNNGETTSAMVKVPMLQIDSEGPFPEHLSFYEVSLKNVIFHSAKGAALMMYFTYEILTNIYVDNCVFFNNQNIDYYSHFSKSSVIAYIKLPDTFYPSGESHVHFTNTIFEKNVGYAGIVFVQNAESSFVNCTFKDNYLLSTVGGMLCNGEGHDNLTLQNGTFLQLQKPNQETSQEKNNFTSFIFSESVGNLVIRSSSFITDETINVYPIINAIHAGYFDLDMSSSIRCPISTTLVFRNVTRFRSTIGQKGRRARVITFQVFCEDCQTGTYSLERGHSTGLIASKQPCQPCPYGATCIDNSIKAQANFWGYEASKHPDTLKFIPCPLEYCRPPSSSGIHDYNSCYGDRTGVLCGACTHGYSETLFSTECREDSKCHDNWFWFITAAYTIMFALFFIIKPPILSFLYQQTFWFKRTPTATDYQPLEANFDPGYLKILFYFYQVAELLLITTPEDLIHKIRFLSPVVGLFNFQVRSLYENVGCPFVGLTAATKEFFLCLKVFATMACTLIIFVIHRAISKTGRLRRPSLSLYLATCMEILLLGYERLADTSLSLLHCVPIGSEWRLFLDGNVQCWEWWQHVLIVYIAVFVAPFIMVLYFGSLKLYANKVSTKEFLGACVLPLPFLVRWTVQHIRKSGATQSDCSDGEEIKTILHESFRPPTEEDKGTVYWESVLLGRRFVLLCFHSFIADPMTRLLCLDCACVLILVHHIIKKPFRDVRANTCETVSLLALVTIATFSFGEAVLMSSGVESTGPTMNHFQVLQWVEAALLGFVPAVFCVLVMFALLSQLCRFIFTVIRKFTNLHKVDVTHEQTGCDHDQQHQPLLVPTSDY